VFEVHLALIFVISVYQLPWFLEIFIFINGDEFYFVWLLDARDTSSFLDSWCIVAFFRQFIDLHVEILVFNDGVRKIMGISRRRDVKG
jgi:hypothetical protein